ncbi:hypothetical protein Sxan_37900 [Streptomyces xanthophaeus]|uniref:Uncharacterized protein n=1 Tax=Streptomyces xanthophaeus TaxID=67385 RepID=A0A919H1B7_9ACTN|nr:hypothetical protein Sxan_37900 [Streptomyces xanthophaeus]
MVHVVCGVCAVGPAGAVVLGSPWWGVRCLVTQAIRGAFRAGLGVGRGDIRTRFNVWHPVSLSKAPRAKTFSHLPIDLHR